MSLKRSKRHRSTKSTLRLPDLDHSKNSVLQSLGSAASKRTYGYAIEDFISWYCSEPRLAFGRTVVLRYRYELESRRLAPATINLRLAAVRRLAYEASDNGLLNPDLAAGIRRVKGAKRLGMKLGNWLTVDQGRRLLAVPSSGSTKDKRDHAILSLLLGCGLRRAELTGLKMSDFQQRDEHWAIVNLFGKGGHIRTVPVPGWAMEVLDEWLRAAQIDEGVIFRRVSRTGSVWGQKISEKLVWWVVRERAKLAGIESWLRTIFGEPVLVFAMQREASWSRSSFSWGIDQSRQRSATWGAVSVSSLP
ncbi:site-specific recombinase XerD [Edaphobacter modestus]|uniref:Site-specific recombinase XerD n=1 Tax=Edaphobacter modestus TaxID=388466 RepID=A0A4Q7YP29_9BACT|nr:tyrosine-type recombinase/integrase [Edaphobacter modestus]RZU39128.1 site-specific recombinase XerD [Edaphobacter modestus]